jgi:TRAP transporter 4TM/12TM fusion protein
MSGGLLDLEPDDIPRQEFVKEVDQGHRSLTDFSRVVEFTILVSLPVVGILFILDLPTRVGMVFFTEQYLGIFLTLCLTGTFLSIPAGMGSKRHSVPWYDWILAVLAFPAGFYLTLRYPVLVMNLGHITFQQVLFGGLAIVLILEAIRRLVGRPLVIIVISIILYARFATYFPTFLGGRPMTFDRLVNYLYLDPNSMLWMLMLAATIGMGFVFFGQVLINFGGGQILTDLATVLCGWTAGGSAKTAVIGSGLVGTITGAPMSNVFITGSITIPMMKASGFPPRIAGAVEAVASSGGQIMPPVMGIGAFIIAENLGVAYAEVALAAFLPALLYYVSLFIQVDLEARKLGITGLSRRQMPPVVKTIKRSWIALGAIGILVYTLFIARMAAGTAATITGLLCLPLLVLLPENRKSFFPRLINSLESSGRMLLIVGVIMSAAGLVVGAFNISGMSFSLSYMLSVAGKSNVMLLLIGAAVASMILGMGMPSAPAYALVAVLIAPALVKFGIFPMAAHLFIFYFAIISNITPPVALACFAAAPLAGTDPMKIGWTAMRLAITIYVIPFLFVFSPVMLLKGSLLSIVITLLTAMVGVAVLGVALTGFLTGRISWLRRVVMAIGAVILLIPMHPGAWDFLLFINSLGLGISLLAFVPEIRVVFNKLKLRLTESAQTQMKSSNERI